MKTQHKTLADGTGAGVALLMANPILQAQYRLLLSRGESLDDSSKEMEAAAEVAVDETVEAVEAEIAAIQTTETEDMPTEVAETVVIDMEGWQ